MDFRMENAARFLAQKQFTTDEDWEHREAWFDQHYGWRLDQMGVSEILQAVRIYNRKEQSS